MKRLGLALGLALTLIPAQSALAAGWTCVGSLNQTDSLVALGACTNGQEVWLVTDYPPTSTVTVSQLPNTPDHLATQQPFPGLSVGSSTPVTIDGNTMTFTVNQDGSYNLQ